MTTDPVGFAHPVTRCVQQLARALDGVADADPTYMDMEAKREALVQLDRIVSQTEGLRMAVMAASGDVAVEDGARTVSAWLTHRTRSWRGANHRAERLGCRLAMRWHRVQAGLAHGTVSVAQAEVIARALDDLGTDVEPELVDRAETHLVELAAEHGPKELRVLGDAILERLDPERFEDAEREKLERAERRAAAATRLSFRTRGDGSTDVSMRIPDASASRLKEYLAAWTSPRHDASVGSPNLDPATGQRLPYERILGNAFCSLLEAIDPIAMPVKAGAATTVVITMKLTDLVAGTGVGELADGTRISAGEVRRMACNAHLVPAVLGGASEVLDLGRASRLFDGRQKLAMAVQHRTCRGEGCSIPAAWCEAHHARDPWSRGGRTDLADGMLLCSWHHHRAHDVHYDMTTHADGAVRFRRRP